MPTQPDRHVAYATTQRALKRALGIWYDRPSFVLPLAETASIAEAIATLDHLVTVRRRILTDLGTARTIEGQTHTPEPIYQRHLRANVAAAQDALSALITEETSPGRPNPAGDASEASPQ